MIRPRFSPEPSQAAARQTSCLQEERTCLMIDTWLSSQAWSFVLVEALHQSVNQSLLRLTLQTDPGSQPGVISPPHCQHETPDGCGGLVAMSTGAQRDDVWMQAWPMSIRIKPCFNCTPSLEMVWWGWQRPDSPWSNKVYLPILGLGFCSGRGYLKENNWWQPGWSCLTFKTHLTLKYCYP